MCEQHFCIFKWYEERLTLTVRVPISSHICEIRTPQLSSGEFNGSR